MKTSLKDYQQQKITGGEQKVILNEKETAETDELDPEFDAGQKDSEAYADPKFELGDDPPISKIVDR